MYPFSVRNCPGPERGYFYISIVDLISRISTVFFSLFCASNYYYNKGPIKVEFFKCKTIHSRLLHSAVLQSIFLQWVIKIVLIYIIVRYTCRVTFTAIIHWPMTDLLFLSYFISNCHGTLILSQILNMFFCGIYEHNFFAAVKTIHNLQFSINNNMCRTQIPVTQTKRPLKDRALSGVR